jgi:hypothetical protein
VRFEGTLDAFSLPDIFQLLSFTRKTGTLHVRRDGGHGTVHVLDGEVTGARGDVARQALGRRLVGSGLVADDALALAVEQLAEEPGAGLGRVLADLGSLPDGAARELAAEQAVDGVFDLLRWVEGEYSFIIGELDPDDLGVRLPVEQVVGEGRRRLDVWAGLTSTVPAADAVVSLAPVPGEPPVLTVDEWQLLALVDGRRTVADLVDLSGRGDFAIVGALAALVDRGLLLVREPGSDGSTAMARRQQLLAGLEGRPPAPAAAPTPVPQLPGPVIPARPEPFLPPRRAEHAEAGTAGLPVQRTGEPAVVDRNVLLRLIAGVQAL